MFHNSSCLRELTRPITSETTNMAYEALLFWGPLLGIVVHDGVWALVSPFGWENSGMCLCRTSRWHGPYMVQMFQASGRIKSSLNSRTARPWVKYSKSFACLNSSYPVGRITGWDVWGKWKCFSVKGWLFLEKVFFPLFPQRHFPFGDGEQLFFIQLVFNFYLMWRNNSDHSQRGFNDGKMVSWLIISYSAFPPERPQITSMRGPLQCKPGSALKGLAYGGYSSNKKTHGKKGGHN